MSIAVCAFVPCPVHRDYAGEKRVKRINGHLLLLVSTTSYNGAAFRAAAERVGVDTLVGSDRCHQLQAGWPDDGMLTLDFRDPANAAAQIVESSRARPLAGVVPTSELTAVIAALAGERLGLPHNPPDAAFAAGNKALLRARLHRGGVATPSFSVVPFDGDAETIARGVRYPCVLKPLLLSASRGVIRADDERSFVVAYHRIARILSDPELLAKDAVAARQILIEDFVPGFEVAVEALLTRGELTVLAVFDKPDPLDGPYFEETLYVTPSRLPPEVQRSIAETTGLAARAIGLVEGPVHAELRLPLSSAKVVPVVIEVAARSIGGLCGRALRFGAGMSLEELLVRHAVGAPLPSVSREASASGVMMIPTPRAGVLTRVDGLERARALDGISEVVIDTVGKRLLPVPEASSYVGFIFARGATPAEVEAALRAAHATLELHVTPELAAMS